jgi:hypothetical protein
MHTLSRSLLSNRVCRVICLTSVFCPPGYFLRGQGPPISAASSASTSVTWWWVVALSQNNKMLFELAFKDRSCFFVSFVQIFLCEDRSVPDDSINERERAANHLRASGSHRFDVQNWSRQVGGHVGRVLADR